MVKHLKFWIVVADGEHARILVPREDGALLTQERVDSKTAHLRSSELGADAPGRVHESASATRHGVAPRTDPHEAAKARFASDLGAWLLQSSRQGAFDELLLVAPSHVLAVLRDSLDKPATDRLRGALARDLTKVPDDELQPHLAEWVRPARRVE